MLFPTNMTARLLMPLLYLNLAGLAVGAVWLGLAGQWQVIWLGVMMLFFSPVILPILIIPAGILSHFMSLHRAAGRVRQEKVMFVCSIAYIVLFMTLWCTGIFGYVMHSVVPATAKAGLLWAATTALAPLLMWSSRDRSNVFVLTMVETAQAAMLALCALYGFTGGGSFWESFAFFGLFMAALAAARVVYDEKTAQKAEKKPH